MKAQRATRQMWELKEMPEAKAELHFERTFSSDEYERISQGLVPRQMEDKWFILLEDDRLTFHRSWTGVCMYEVRLERAENAFRVSQAWVNRESEWYKTAYEADLLAFLIDRLLLGKKVPFLHPTFDVQAPAVYRHAMVGYNRANDEDV